MLVQYGFKMVNVARECPRKKKDLTTWRNASYVSKIISTMASHLGLLILLIPYEATHSTNLAPTLEWLMFTNKTIYAALKESSRDRLTYLLHGAESFLRS